MGAFAVVISAAAMLALDVVTKSWAMTYLEYGEPLRLVGPMKLRLVYNTGAAFGLFPGMAAAFAAFNCVVIVGMLIYGVRVRSWGMRVAAGVVAGGAAGNLVDRLRFGAVTDFVDVGWWPVFNVADAGIVIGLVLLCWLHFRREMTEGGKPECDR